MNKNMLLVSFYDFSGSESTPCVLWGPIKVISLSKKTIKKLRSVKKIKIFHPYPAQFTVKKTERKSRKKNLRELSVQKYTISIKFDLLKIQALYNSKFRQLQRQI